MLSCASFSTVSLHRHSRHSTHGLAVTVPSGPSGPGGVVPSTPGTGSSPVSVVAPQKSFFPPSHHIMFQPASYVSGGPSTSSFGSHAATKPPPHRIPQVGNIVRALSLSMYIYVCIFVSTSQLRPLLVSSWLRASLFIYNLMTEMHSLRFPAPA